MPKNKYPLRGIVVSLDTPFNENGRIDFGSLERLVERHLSENAVGFLVPARAAEVEALAFDEKIELISRVREQVRGRAHTVAGATSIEERETFLIAEHAARL